MKRLVYSIILFIFLLSCNDESKRKKAVSMNKSAIVSIESKNYPSAIEGAKEALKTFQSISDTIGIIESYYLLARASVLSGDFDQAIAFGELGSGLSKQINNYPMEYKLNNTLSWAYFELGKSFDETLEHQKRQMFVVDQLNEEEAKAGVYNNFGYDATVSGSVSLNEAIGYSKFANSHYAETEKNNGRWYTLMNLTWQHRLINDLPTSEEYGRMAVKQAEIDNDRHAIIEANTTLGETLLLQNKVEEAKSLYERGLELSKQKDDRDRYVFDVYYSRYLWNTSQKDTAISILKNAINFLEESEIFYEMLGRAYLAEFYYSTNDVNEASKQIRVFKNPRANYFSQEAKVIAKTIEAQIIANKDKERAIEMLENELLELDKSGAKLLKSRISDLIDQIQ